MLAKHDVLFTNNMYPSFYIKNSKPFNLYLAKIDCSNKKKKGFRIYQIQFLLCHFHATLFSPKDKKCNAGP